MKTLLFAKEASSIGIIGGADGPTAIFVTGKLPLFALLAAGLAAAAVLALLIWLFLKRR